MGYRFKANTAAVKINLFDSVILRLGSCFGLFSTPSFPVSPQLNETGYCFVVAAGSFMRLVLCCCCCCCCCVRAHPPSTQAGGQIKKSWKLGAFHLRFSGPFKSLLRCRSGSAQLTRSAYFPLSIAVLALSPRAGASLTGDRRIERGRSTTAIRLPALQLAQHFN